MRQQFFLERVSRLDQFLLTASQTIRETARASAFNQRQSLEQSFVSQTNSYEFVVRRQLVGKERSLEFLAGKRRPQFFRDRNRVLKMLFRRRGFSLGKRHQAQTRV